MSQKIQVRRGTAAIWAANNPTLLRGEIGFEYDTVKVKIGDGSTPWNSLAYAVVSQTMVEDLIADHADRTDNPHSVTKAQVGLGNVDNTSDANKPISSATQSALDLKYDSSNPSGYVDATGAAGAAPVQSVAGRTGTVVLTKTDVGLSNVPNTDATLRSNHTGTQLASTISDFTTASQSAIISQTITNNDTTHSPSADAVHDALASEEAARIAIGDRVTDIENDYGVAGGLATLDGSGKISTSMLPGTVLEYKGTWDASSNTPTLQNGTPANTSADAGHIYRVSVAGTVNFGAGNITFSVGDDVILSESLVWERSPGGSLVISVNGFQGEVTLDSEDIALTTSVASASDVQHALENIYASVSSTMTDHTEALDPHPQYETSDEAQAKVDAHANLTNNPHSVTKAQIGLGDVDNVSASSLRDRSTHTGTQLASTISDFTAAVQGVTIDAAKIDSGVVSNAEFATLDGINTASTIQSQLDGKESTITGAATTVTASDLTASRVLVSNTSGKIAASSITSTELSYLSSVSSSIQTQLNGKEPTITAGTASQYYRGDKTFQTLDKTAVGLSNVDNVSAANLRDRSTHTGTQLASTISDFTTAVQAVTIDAAQIDGGGVSNTEFSYLANVTSDIQSQLNGKQATGNYITALTGDVTATGPGSVAATLSNTGVSAGTYDQVTVDAKGRVTAGAVKKYIYTTTAQTTNNATANYTAIAGMTTVSLPAGLYSFRFDGQYQSAATTTGVSFRMTNGTATVTTCYGKWYTSQAADGTAKNFQTDQLTSTTAVPSTATLTINTNANVSGEGIFRVTVAGTMIMQIRTEVNGSQVLVQPDAVLIIEPIA